jgi:hypothetical protein
MGVADFTLTNAPSVHRFDSWLSAGNIAAVSG